ncbi:MAG: NAD(P)/FAD-dependent oxidoreductase [Planctomycetaceae bacterium]|nr:NAD(P)/FAD-dependent oxidoreductase [Planctomycetaceae bacterium]
MSSESPEFDVAVVGAGPAGSATALDLRRRGISVVVLESRPAAVWKIGETLPPAARPLLQALGVLEAFESDGHLLSYGNHSAWGSEGLDSKDFIFGPHGNGWQLDRKRFDERLAEAAGSAGACLWYESRFLAARRCGDAIWELKVAVARDRRVIRVRWLVDATGRSNTVARHLGARRSALDALFCVYAVARPASCGALPDADTRTLVEAAAEGWWYTALMPGGRRTVAWLTDQDLLRRHPWRTGTWFVSHIRATRHLSKLLDRHDYGFAEPPRCSSACSGRAEPWCGAGWLAVGDAAMTFDPLSSQGLWNALATGDHAARTVAESLDGDRLSLPRYSIDLEEVWEAYVRNRLEFYRIEQRWAGEPFWRRRH